jgi:hypothetical protein
MLTGYMRVSKADGSQVLDLQRDALVAAGVKSRHLCEDQASGKRDDRPGLDACLKSLHEGDTLIVWKLDRLGRSLRHLVNTIHDLMERGVGLRVPARAPTSTPRPPAAGWCSVFSRQLAEFERELPREDDRWPLLRPRSWPQGRPALYDDARQAAPGAGRHGQARHQASVTCARSWALRARRSTASSAPRAS